MVGLQLGANQKYYISRCEEKQSIQLTITVVGDDEKHVQERKDLISDVTESLNNIMKMFMPGTKKPLLIIPCVLCPKLHKYCLMPYVASGKTIFCPFVTADKSLPNGYYSDLLQPGLTDATTAASKMIELTSIYIYIYIYIYIII